MRTHALRLLACAALGLGVGACSDTRNTDRNAQTDTPSASAPDVAANDYSSDRASDADDTGLNARDREGSTVLPTDQSTAKNDEELTRMIRQKISERDELSTDAENVKVVAANGVVTLRGPVESEAEKKTIVDIAQKTEGVSRVDDQLEVATR